MQNPINDDNIEASRAEKATGSLSEEKLAKARHLITTRGYAVVTGLISEETQQLLMSSMLEDVEKVRSQTQLTAHEERTGRGHLQLGARRHAPWVPADLVANPVLESVVAAVLGDGAWIGFYNGNVNCPGSTYQPLHFDRPFAWLTESEARAAGQDWPPPTTTLSCSVALSDIDETTGATEIYPGTHHETAVTTWPAGERPQAHPDLIEKWGPPSSMKIPAGAVCFRDPRMWHRGVPNPSDTARPMLALTWHSALATHWRGLLVRDINPDILKQCRDNPGLRVMDNGGVGDGRLVFHESARPAFEANPPSHGVDRYVRFVDDPYTVNHFLDAHLMGGARVAKNGPVEPWPSA